MQLSLMMVGNLNHLCGTCGPHTLQLNSEEIAGAQDKDQPCTFLHCLNKLAFLYFSPWTHPPSMTRAVDGDFNLFIAS